MKAPAAPTRNPLAARHLAVQGPGISVEQQNIRGQQSLSVAGTLRAPAEAQDINRFKAQRLQELQEFNTQQLGANRAIGGLQAELATAPQGDYLQKQPNMTAAAELMTPEQKAQALVDLHKARVIEAAEQATGQGAKLRQLT